MISLYIIAGFFLAVAVVGIAPRPYAERLEEPTGPGVVFAIFVAAVILAFTEWARATGVF